MKFPRFGKSLSARRPTPAALPLAGQFQRYNHTLPDRYPWIFDFAADALSRVPTPRLLSFGCSRGDEVFALHRRFPAASITGIDVDPANIKHSKSRALEQGIRDAHFLAAADTAAQANESYDAIFCLAVLCLGDLTTTGAIECEPYLSFERFEGVVEDFSRCLKPDGLLFLHTTNFRFCDTRTAARFDMVLEASPNQMADDVLFDTHNKLMPGARYFDVGFRKRAGRFAAR
jgi:cyclopropane fatty-acyl-phospholipid synthase-like methyltransferase